MNKKECVGSFCIIFYASLFKYWKKLSNPCSNFFPDSFVNCLYSSIFLVVLSSTEFILRRGLMDRTKARLIYFWTRCRYLAGRFIFVKAVLVFSKEEVLGWGLDLNLGDGEEKMIFWRIFGFVRSNISVIFLCCRGDIVNILCSGWIHPWKCRNEFLDWTRLEV